MSVLLMIRYKNCVLMCFVIFCGAFLVYWRYCHELRSHSPTLEEILTKHTVRKIYPVLEIPPALKIPPKDEKELLFEELLNYILHPKGHCKAPVTLGGVRFKDNKLDGNKMVCLDPGSPLKKDCIGFSFGVDIETSFENSLHLAFNCRVYAFDPKLINPGSLNSKEIRFFDRGVGAFDANVVIGAETLQINTFDAILHELKPNNRTIDVVKMDMEGGEYYVLKDMLKKELMDSVNHLSVQIYLEKETDWSTTLQLLRAIEKSGMVHFSTRNNTRSSMQKVPGHPHRQEHLVFDMAWTRISTK